jgi:hypothetical protein
MNSKEGGSGNGEFKREKHRKSICEENLVGVLTSEDIRLAKGVDKKK